MNTPSFPRMHVSLYVADIDRTVKFYETFFGQAAEKVKPGYAKFHLSEPSLIISFVENAKEIAPLFGHLGFQVETSEQLEQRLAAAKDAGLGILEEKGTNCCYATQDKFWVADPDGYRWEVYHFHQDVEWNDPHYSTGEACCSPAMVTAQEPAKAESCCTPRGGCC
ncbi:MAG: VOC family protein [Flavobacteriales bacterium]|nr:VOC family protein [Flavobacteriales bacterium]